jgi:sugar-specific transcriptional regulator TrmB
MHIQTIIQQLGFRPQEAKVYLAALALGECTTIDLTNKTKLPRTSVQAVVQQLHTEGLLNLYVKKSRKIWVAENPEKLLIHLKEREAALKNIMPELQAMRYDTGLRPVVRLYSGIEEIEHIMEDMLSTKHHILGLIDWDKWVSFFGKDFLDDFINKRTAQNLKIKMLVTRTAQGLKLKERDHSELRNTRFLPPHHKLKNTNFIYGNKVALISLNKRFPLGILIEDIDITDTITMLHESLWKQSSEH